jgi:subtilisin family serine protease
VVAVAAVAAPLWLATAPVRSAPPTTGPEPKRADVAAEVTAAIRRTGRAEVVIALRDGAAPDLAEPAMAAAVARAQDAVLAALPAGSFALRYRYGLIPALAGTINAAGLTGLQAQPQVVAVEANRTYEVALKEAVPVVKADRVHAMGVTGKGVTVAVLDTGIDNSHPDFGGKIVDQHCFSGSRSCAPSNIAESTNAQDEAGHGTAVSGIILSRGTVSSVGVAPDASLVAVRVFRDQGGASYDDIVSGLDWVLRRQTALRVRVVNMSLGSYGSHGVNCDDQNPTTKEAFQRLVARGVAIFVATGNNGFPSNVSAPACISNSIAVGATYDATFESVSICPRQQNVTPLTIACFTNRGRAMDLLAPGLWISAPMLGGGVTSPGAGTSYAAPMAAGVAALMLEANPDLRPSDIERVMQETGTSVNHPENDDVFPLVDALRAVQAVLPASPTPSPTPSAPAPPTATSPSVTATAPATSTPAPPTPAPPTATPVTPPTATAPEPPARWTVYLPALRKD